MSDIYTRALREKLLPLAREAGIPLREGVYVMYSGPNYETPAEIRFFRAVGGDAAEMLEALVPDDSALAGKRVQELGLPKGILLLGVIRGGEAFIPSGQSSIQPQDRIVLLALREKMSKLEEIVSRKRG